MRRSATQRWIITPLRGVAGVCLAALALASCGETPSEPTPPTPDPPAIACSSNVDVVSADGKPLTVVYTSPSVAGGVAPVAVSCAPASGSTFAIGPTAVTCTATDAKQRTASCALTVTVTVPPQIAVTRFAAFGDSITVGTDGQNTITTSFGGPLLFRNHAILYGSEYPTVLQQMLKSRYTTQACQIGVTNLGFAGEPAGELPPDYPGITALQRFQNEVIGKSYQSVLIMEGSNDTYFAYNAPSQSAQTAMLQAAATNIRKMVQLARGNGLRPYLATIPPQNRNACVPICRGYGHELVAPYNDLIRGVALTEGAPLVDVFQAFNGDLSLLSPDGLHPNAAGFERIADTFFNAVKNTIEVPATAPSACTN